MAEDLRYAELRRKFHPVLLEMDRRRVRLHEMQMRNGRLYMRAEAWSPDDLNYVWMEVRAIDPDLVELTLDLSVGRGQDGSERAADRDIDVTARKPPEKVRQAGDRGTPTGDA